MDRPRPGRPPKVTCGIRGSTSIASLIKTPSSMAPSTRNGVAANSPRCWPKQTGVQLGRESVRGVFKKKR